MIWVCAYRDWANKIYQQVNLTVSSNLISSKEQFNNSLKLFNKGDKIFFLGWSWIIPNDIINKYECICLHPSPLPKYRGGSPIQHQILNGEITSSVTFFKMTDKVDAGPIFFQKDYSLDGNLSDIFTRVISLGIEGVLHILNNNIIPLIQDEDKASYVKRRKKSASEIKINDLNNYTSKELHNKIRCLQDPYPNAFITCKNGSKLYIKLSKYEN